MSGILSFYNMLSGKELVTFIKLDPELKEGMLEWEAIRGKIQIVGGTSQGDLVYRGKNEHGVRFPYSLVPQPHEELRT